MYNACIVYKLHSIIIILSLIHHFTVGFPNELQQYGATESLLQRAFLQCAKREIDLCWTPVTIGFYQELHKYLQKWAPSRSATKTTIGRLIDSRFQTRISSRPDNIYMFVQIQVRAYVIWC